MNLTHVILLLHSSSFATLFFKIKICDSASRFRTWIVKEDRLDISIKNVYLLADQPWWEAWTSSREVFLRNKDRRLRVDTPSFRSVNIYDF